MTVPKKRTVVYYLTNDVANPREGNEIGFLECFGRVVCIAPVKYGRRCLVLPERPAWTYRLQVLWQKIIFLVCRLVPTRLDQQFPVRNIYTGPRFARSVINRLWKYRTFRSINRRLPTFEWLYFAPFHLAARFAPLLPFKRSVQRVFVYDSLIVRLNDFAYILARARRAGYRCIANVKSWDNPYYSQFSGSQKYYLVWSAHMTGEIQRIHRRLSIKAAAWGPRPFQPFYDYCSMVRTRRQREPLSPDGCITVGYAAAFSEEYMARIEIAFIARLAGVLAQAIPNVKILVRPYPIVAASVYHDYCDGTRLELLDIEGTIVDRYKNATERIKFGSYQERLEFLDGCDCFLSFATSFTIEAAVADLPIVHVAFPPGIATTADEQILFRRLEICDHVAEYFNVSLRVAANEKSLVGLVLEAVSHPDGFSMPNRRFRELLGFPDSSADWDCAVAPAVQRLLR